MSCFFLFSQHRLRHQLAVASTGIRWGKALIRLHYYRNLNHGGQKGLIEAVFATVSDERSRLIVALIKAVALNASVNVLIVAGSLQTPAYVNE
jgi:hypothetical protein